MLIINVRNQVKAFLVINFLITIYGFSQDKLSHQWYNKKGKKVNYGQMLKACEKGGIILFGEFHDNPIAHWLQLELAYDLLSKDLVMGGEFFEHDQELVLQDCLSDSSKNMDSLLRLWPNYWTDYDPLIKLAQRNVVPFHATNVPRRYAALVYRHGFDVLDTLPDAEKINMPPLPIPYDSNLPAYQEMLDMMGGHGGENFPKAQAIKDAAMAHFILKYKEDKSVFLHFNGSFHSNNNQGIAWYLKQYNPGIEVVVIGTVSQDNVEKLDQSNMGIADFILVVDSKMTRTH